MADDFNPYTATLQRKARADARLGADDSRFFGESEAISDANRLGMAGHVGGYGAVQGAGLAAADQARQGQLTGLAQYAAAMQGQLPSVAMAQQQQAYGQSAYGAGQMAARMGGVAGRAAGIQAGAQGLGGAVGQAAMARAQEIQAARQGYLGGAARMGEQDLGIAQLGMQGMSDWQNKLQAQYAAELDARMRRQGIAAGLAASQMQQTGISERQDMALRDQNIRAGVNAGAAGLAVVGNYR